MAQVTPKHVRAPAHRRTARTRRSIELALLTFAVVLAVLVFVTEIRGAREDPGTSADAGPASTATSPGQAVATPMAPATTTAAMRPPPGELLGDPGFEHGLGNWRAVAGELRPSAVAHGGVVGAVLTGGAGATLSSGPVGTVKAGATYVGTLWVRSERPGVNIEVRVLERVNGRPFATDLVGDMAGTGWQQLEVIHTGHRKGAVLEFQVAALRLGGGALFVDDASLRAGGASPMPGMSP